MGVIGTPINRTGGKLKVTGGAKYSAEIHLPGMTYAVLVGSVIAKGRLKSIDAGDAERASGVLAALTHLNAQKLKPVGIFSPGGKAPTLAAATRVLPLQGDEIFHRGQPVACVVAETLEQAQHAATLVKITYEEQQPTADFEKALSQAETPESVWGMPAIATDGAPNLALAEAAVKVDEIYVTPFEHHNTIEMHATIAVWQDNKLTVYDSTRYVQGERRMLAETFGLDPKQVRVVSKFIGGAFGEKGATRAHVPLAVMCSMKIGRPVSLSLTRRQMTSLVGHRPTTRQRVALGATAEGKLVAIIHEGASSCSAIDTYVEPFSAQTYRLYAGANRRIAQRIVRLNAAQPTTMRAPGEASGMFALESAMDELAHKLKIDPVELRRLNEPPIEPVTGKEFSNRRLLACLEKGAQAFDWSKRKPQPRSRRDGDFLIGMGFAVATYPLKASPASARCRIFADGRALTQSSTHEVGNGVATSMRQIAADALGISLDRIDFEYGDTDLPNAPITGGSTTTMWVGTATRIACEQARAKVIALASAADRSPLCGATEDEISFAENRLFLTKDPSKGETYQAIVSRSGGDMIEALAEVKLDEEKKMRFAMDSYGAHFCEVAVDADTGEVRVRRHLGVFNCGRIINPKLARSQFIGAITMGIGMALMEENTLDARNGFWIRPDLADYHVPAAADIRGIEVTWLDDPDEHVNPLGAKGLGEIGNVGAAAAVANAVFNATGKRIRALPITPGKLL
jgi:xanthine dehydrogenase YagR molybdenum-binding subunit